MLNLIINIYRILFGRTAFYRFNRTVYLCSLRGMGILNYESDRLSGEEHFIQKYLSEQKGGVVLDVGANIGEYSSRVLKTNPSLSVYAFEPHPKTFSILRDAIKHPSFLAVNAAVGSEKGSAELFDYASKDGSAHASLFKDVIERTHLAPSMRHQVEVITLSDFVRDHQISHISLLKLDTEGNELNALKGIKDFIQAGAIDLIHFEFNEMNVSSKTFFRDFWDILPNYNLYRLLPDGMIRLEEYNSLYCEIFAYQNIVAILKHE